MKSQRITDGERTLAVFIDFENLALGFGNRRDRFNIDKVLERLVEKGKIVAKKAYADWSRFGFYTNSLHEAAVELIEIPKRMITGKNSADIRMCVDAMDLAYSKDHIDTFVVVSGDSDFSPLVSKLKELGKHVIGLGLADSTSDLLRDNCDEFIYYEDLDRGPVVAIEADQGMPEQKRKLFALLLDSLHALKRENKEVIFSSMVKDTMKRKKPSFNEEYYGYRTFSDLLEDAQRAGLVDLERHKTAGTYVVTRFGSDNKAGAGQMLPPTQRTLALPPAPGPEQPRREDRREERRPERRPAAETPPPARKVVTLPPLRPAAPPPPAPQPIAERERPDWGREREPEAAREPETRVPLGRELIEELDDDLDEIPSYRPAKPVSARPAVPPPPRPARQPRGESRSEPRAARGPAEAPPRRSPPPPPARSSPDPERSADRPPPPPARRATKPRPAETDDFSAGLD